MPHHRTQALLAAGLNHRFAFFDKFKANLGQAQGKGLHQLLDIPQFGGLRAEKFEPGGGIVKEIADRQTGAHRPASGAVFDDFTALDHQAFGNVMIGGAGQNFDPRHRGNAGQCLAAKAHGIDTPDIFKALQFAGGKTLKGQTDTLSRNTKAIVDNPQKAPTLIHFNLDKGRTGIEGVFNQFFNHRSRPLNHLTRSNLVGDLGIKQLNRFHYCSRVAVRRRFKLIGLPLPPLSTVT